MSAWPVEPQELEGYGWRGQPVTLPRPGHADLAGVLKYGHDDVRNVLERASARETAGRVAAGAVAKALIATIGIRVRSHVLQVGTVRATPPAWLQERDFDRAEASEVRCLDPDAEAAMIAEIEQAKRERDTLGGVTEVRAFGVPPGLGLARLGRRAAWTAGSRRRWCRSSPPRGSRSATPSSSCGAARIARARRDLPLRRARLPPPHRHRRRPRGRHDQRRRRSSCARSGSRCRR